MHNHSHCCKHEKVVFCKKCNVPYCEECGKEWPEKCTLSHYFPYTYYPGTYPSTWKGDEPYCYPFSTCSHNS